MTSNSATSAIVEQCWCGNTTLVPSPHADYLVCRACGTAKLRAGLATGQVPVTNEQDHLYGEHYWNEHMVRQGYPPLAARARADLAERDQYWLMHLLKYFLPPGRTLEIGCAHGAFVKLLSAAGFDAIGMDMSPGVIRKAKEWFGVEIARGPIEYADPPIGQFDVVLMFDVIEHLATPVETMHEVVGRVAADGLVVVQTPQYDLVTGSKWFQFRPPEHTFLFSSQSIRVFFRQLGFDHFAEEPSMFGGDMFVFASRKPLPQNPPDRIAERLASTPDGRLVLAMQDMYKMLRDQPNQDLASRYGPRVLGASFVRSLRLAITRRLWGRC